MGKHNKGRRSVRPGQIIVAAAAATVIGGWAAPVAYADGGDPGSDAGSKTVNKPVSKAIGAAAGAAKDAVDTVRKTVTDVGSQLQKSADRAIQTGAGGNGRLTSLVPKGPTSKVSSSGGFLKSERESTVEAALVPPTSPSNDDPTGSVTIPIVDVTLPHLPDAPRIAFPTPSPGLPPGFGSQGTNNRPPLGPLSAVTNGNNLFGLNFFDIGNNNLFTANNVGTGLQGIIAGNGNTLVGNQVIAPTSFGTNFGWMGNDNGTLALNPAALLTLTPSQILALRPSGNNIVGSPFSYGNNTTIMGNNNDGTGNNILLGAGNFGNNMHWIGDNADFAGNNIVTGIGSVGNNMSIIGDNSSLSGNNTNLGAFGFANNIGLIGSAATGSGNNTNVSPLFGFAQNAVLIGDGADNSGNNRAGGFNLAWVGSGVDNAGNNNGGGFNVAILPRPGQNCNGPACFNFLGAQFGN